MPRPSTITDEDIARWDASFEEFDPVALGMMPFFKQLRGIKDACWYPTQWLGEELDKLSCPDEIKAEICGAAGQRLAVSRDPWIPVTEALEDYRGGEVNTSVPTMELSENGLRYVSDGNRQDWIRG
jgi:hypothetical protein